MAALTRVKPFVARILDKLGRPESAGSYHVIGPTEKRVALAAKALDSERNFLTRGVAGMNYLADGDHRQSRFDASARPYLATQK